MTRKSRNLTFYFLLWNDYQPPITESELQSVLDDGFLDWVADDVDGLESTSEISGLYLSTSLAGSPSKCFFEQQLRAYFPDWDQLQPRFKLVVLFPRRHVQWPAGHLRRLIRRDGPIQQDDIQKWKEDGVSLTYWIFRVFNNWSTLTIEEIFGTSNANSSPKIWTEWQQLLVETILAAEDLHLMHSPDWTGSLWSSGGARFPKTFLESVVFRTGEFDFAGCRRWDYGVEKRLNVLLHALRMCGVDLEAYGKDEFELWESEYGATHVATAACVNVLDWNCKRYRWKYGLVEDLMSAIHYGPNPEDWYIEWDTCRDYPEVFWNMVENPLQLEVMPGTWVNDESDDDNKRMLISLHGLLFFDGECSWLPKTY